MGNASYYHHEFSDWPPPVSARADAFSREQFAFRQNEKGTIMVIEAYCMKCKEKKEMKDPVEGTTKNGKPITKGTCPVCGSTICRIGAAK